MILILDPDLALLGLTLEIIKELKMARRGTAWVVVLCGLSAAALIVMAFRRGQSGVTFRVVDRTTGVAVSNVVFKVHQPWPKPFRWIPLPIFSKWKTDTIQAERGITLIRGLSLRHGERVRVGVDIDGVTRALFVSDSAPDHPDWIFFHAESFSDQVNRTNDITFRIRNPRTIPDHHLP